MGAESEHHNKPGNHTNQHVEPHNHANSNLPKPVPVPVPAPAAALAAAAVAAAPHATAAIAPAAAALPGAGAGTISPHAAAAAAASMGLHPSVFAALAGVLLGLVACIGTCVVCRIYRRTRYYKKVQHSLEEEERAFQACASRPCTHTAHPRSHACGGAHVRSPDAAAAPRAGALRSSTARAASRAASTKPIRSGSRWSKAICARAGHKQPPGHAPGHGDRLPWGRAACTVEPCTHGTCTCTCILWSAMLRCARTVHRRAGLPGWVGLVGHRGCGRALPGHFSRVRLCLASGQRPLCKRLWEHAAPPRRPFFVGTTWGRRSSGARRTDPPRWRTSSPSCRSWPLRPRGTLPTKSTRRRGYSGGD